jgi:hypothetical protein
MVSGIIQAVGLGILRHEIVYRSALIEFYRRGYVIIFRKTPAEFETMRTSFHHGCEMSSSHKAVRLFFL